MNSPALRRVVTAAATLDIVAESLDLRCLICPNEFLTGLLTASYPDRNPERDTSGVKASPAGASKEIRYSVHLLSYSYYWNHHCSTVP